MRTKYKGELLCEVLSIAIAINSLDVLVGGGHSYSPVSFVKEAAQMKMGADNKKRQKWKRGISVSVNAEKNVKEGGDAGINLRMYAARCTLRWVSTVQMIIVSGDKVVTCFARANTTHQSSV